jgi:two-component system, response regulator
MEEKYGALVNQIEERHFILQLIPELMTDSTDVEILLVEDNIHDAELTLRALRKADITKHIVHLKNGQEGLDFIFGRENFSGRDTSRQPKVILLDLKMPKVNGLDVIKELKADEMAKMIPIVVLTSSREDPDIETCYRLGVNSYIVKPVEFENFSKAVIQLGLYWLVFNHPSQ